MGKNVHFLIMPDFGRIENDFGEIGKDFAHDGIDRGLRGLREFGQVGFCRLQGRIECVRKIKRGKVYKSSMAALRTFSELALSV